MRFLYLMLLLPINLVAYDSFELVIEKHQFRPEVLFLPAGKKIELVVINKDNSVEEFESFDLRREKIIPAHGQITIKIGPLEKGEYNFFGEFHQKSAKGKIVVK